MPLSFLTPWFLLAGLAVIVPVLIHLIERRREVILDFPMVRFVLLARKRSSRRLRLRRILLLLLRAAAILLAAFILGRPVLRSPASDFKEGGGGHTVIVLDNSLSMAARSGGRSRAEILREAARGIVLQSGETGRFAVVTAGERRGGERTPRWTGAQEAIERIDATEPLPDRGDFVRAFREAYLLLRGGARGQRRIVVLTDLALGSWSEFSLLAVGESDPDVPVRIYRVGRETGGAGVTGIRLTGESLVAGEELAVEGKVLNWGPDENIPLELLVDGEPQDRKILTIAPAAEGDFSFDMGALRAGRHELQVRLREDGYREDDSRLYGATFDAPVEVLLVDGEPSLSLVKSETFFLREALRSERLAPREPIAARVVGAEEFARTDLASFDVVILANVAAPAAGRRLPEFVSQGGGLMVFWGENCLGEEYSRFLPALLPGQVGSKVEAGAEGPFRIGELDYDDEILSIFRPPDGGSFAGVSFVARAEVDGVLPGAAAPARFADGEPWLVTGSVGEGRVLLFTTTADLEWGDLPTKPVFVPLLRRAVLSLAGRLGGMETGEVTAGEEKTFRGEEKDAFSTLAVTNPEGETVQVEFRPGEEEGVTASFRETERVGFYRWSGGAREGVFAVNVPAAESDLRVMDEGDMTSRFQGVPLDLFVFEEPAAAAEFSQAGTRGLARSLYTVLFFLLLIEMLVAGPRLRVRRSAAS